MASSAMTKPLILVFNQTYSQRTPDSFIKGLLPDCLSYMNNNDLSFIIVEGKVTDTAVYTGMIRRYNANICCGMVSLGNDIYGVQISNGTVTYKQAT